MNDNRMELLALLTPGSEHAAEIGLLAGDLEVGRREVERLVGQLQALDFQVVSEHGRVWIDWRGWPQARRAAEAHVAQDPT